MRKKRLQGGFLLNLFTCFLLPAYTLLFAGSITWFGTNFSVIAVTGEDHYRGFFLWGLLAGAVFLVLLVRIIHSLPGKWGKLPLYGTTWMAVSSLIYTLLIPYLPKTFPAYADLHVALAMAACVWLMLTALIILVWRCKLDWSRWRGCLLGWGLIVAGSGLLFAMAGMVSSALEIFFTLSAALLLRKMFLLSR